MFAADMVCVPGGAFLLGSHDTLPTFVAPSVPERLVQLSPFWMDRDELTVAELETLVATKGVAAPSFDYPYCSWFSSKPKRPEYPVNCISKKQYF